MKYFVPPYYTVIIDDHEVQITSTSNKKRGAALSQRLDTTGYLIVTLIPEKGSRRKITKRVHILVAELVYGQVSPTPSYSNITEIENYKATEATNPTKKDTQWTNPL